MKQIEPAFPIFIGKLALHFLCLAHLLTTIFNCTTSTNVSFLHFGQYNGNFIRTVSLYTFVLVFPPQIGQRIQSESFIISHTVCTSNTVVAPRLTSGSFTLLFMLLKTYFELLIIAHNFICFYIQCKEYESHTRTNHNPLQRNLIR